MYRLLIRKKDHGFTLIELLLVIAIIGILSSIVLASLNNARNKGKAAKAKTDLTQIRNVMLILSEDTGRTTNGCPYGVMDSPETTFDSAWAGLISVPIVGADATYSGNPGGCGWTASNIAAWKGPYLTSASVIDPWGRPYVFDPDYLHQDGIRRQTILSLGPTGAINNESASDIIISISN